MKCPACGQWNRASLPVCGRCGTALTPPDPRGEVPEWKSRLQDGQPGAAYYRMNEDGVSDAAPDERELLAAEMAELKERKADGTRAQRRLREAGASRGAAPSAIPIRTGAGADAFWNIEDGRTSAVRFNRPMAREGDSRTAVRMGTTALAVDDAGFWDDTRGWDPLWAEQRTYGTRWQTPRTQEVTAVIPARRRALRRFLRVLLVLLIAAVLAAAGYLVVTKIQERRAAEKEKNAPSVVASMKDELATHTIMIPGEDGQQIYIRELHTSYVVQDGFATVEVADHTWYDNLDDLLDETMTVTLTPFLKTESGRQQPLDPISYEIEIPLSPLTLMTPDGMRQVVASQMYTMKFEVRPGSTVYINDRNVSDTVNSSTGILSYNATVQPVGDNDFTVRVRSQYCRENVMHIVLYREPQEIPLDLAADTYTSTSLEAMQVNCTTLPGARVDVLSPFSDLNVTDLDATGAFSFYAVFDHIGDNVIEIQATYPGKKPSLVQYTVYYLPPADIYTKKAWPLSPEGYSELVSNISYRAEHSQVYVVMGTIDRVVSEKPQMAVFNTSADGQTQPVLVENFSKTTWEPGKFYRIYADAYSTYDNMPWLCGRYTYTN